MLEKPGEIGYNGTKFRSLEARFMRKAVIAVILAAALLLALASGCAMRSDKTDPTSADATTIPTTTDPVVPPTDPTEGPTVPADAPTEPTPTDPTPTEPEEPSQPEKKLTVCIDAGHQRYGISEKEPNGQIGRAHV